MISTRQIISSFLNACRHQFIRGTSSNTAANVKPAAVVAAAPKVAGENSITVNFVKGEKTYKAHGKEGDTLLDLVMNNELDFDGFGACEGTLACSTCHVILEKEVFDKLPNPACDEELDMLDLAYDLSPTSRLGCQICLTKDLTDIKVTIPETRHDARS